MRICLAYLWYFASTVTAPFFQLMLIRSKNCCTVADFPRYIPRADRRGCQSKHFAGSQSHLSQITAYCVSIFIPLCCSYCTERQCGNWCGVNGVGKPYAFCCSLALPPPPRPKPLPVLGLVVEWHANENLRIRHSRRSLFQNLSQQMSYTKDAIYLPTCFYFNA